MSQRVEKGDRVKVLLSGGKQAEGIIKSERELSVIVGFFKPTEVFEDSGLKVMDAEFKRLEVFLVRKAQNPTPKALTPPVVGRQRDPKKMDLPKVGKSNKIPAEIDTRPMLLLIPWLKAQAILTEIKAMEVENLERERRGEACAYPEASFFEKAEELNELHRAAVESQKEAK